MKGPFHSINGIAYPEEIDLLRRVFDQFCRENGVIPGGPDAEDLSRAAMSLFTAGVVEEAHLVESLAEYVRRRTKLIPPPSGSVPTSHLCDRGSE